MSDWPFCDPSTEPTRDTEATPSTVCAVGASSELETGAYLDASVVVRGPSSSLPALQDEETGDDGFIGRGKTYIMSGGSADASVTMSEWVQTDDYGWTKVTFQTVFLVLVCEKRSIIDVKEAYVHTKTEWRRFR